MNPRDQVFKHTRSAHAGQRDKGFYFGGAGIHEAWVFGVSKDST